jgi:hypothetical protein
MGSLYASRLPKDSPLGAKSTFLPYGVISKSLIQIDGGVVSELPLPDWRSGRDDASDGKNLKLGNLATADSNNDAVGAFVERGVFS